MRVLQLIDSLEAGGAERVAVNIANALANEIQLSCLCATRKEGALKHSINKNVGYLFLGKKSILDYKALKKVKKYVSVNNINVIHAHSSSFFFAVIIKWLLFKQDIRVVWHDHYGNSEFLERRKPIVLKVFSKSFSHIVSVNKQLVNWSKSYLGHKKVLYLPNFAAKDTITPKVTLKGAPNKRIICLANLRPQKDHFTLFSAFKDVIKDYPLWTLHLVGKDFNDSYSKKVKQEIKSLSNNVFLYGSCRDIQNILSQSTIGVLTSQSEGLPLALLEYGLAGLPVIVTDVGECGNVVGKDGAFGVVVKPKDSREVYKAIIKLINNANLRTIMALAFQNKVHKMYSKDSAMKKIIEIYKR